MPEAELNNPKGLSNDAAVEAVMASLSSDSTEPKGSTKEEEVTQPEEALTTEEAALKETQIPTVETPEEKASKALIEDSEEESEEESEEDSDEEADETEASDEEQSEEPDTEEADELPDDQAVFMTLEDGTEISVEEAKKGYLRQKDYTQKTQQLAEGRKALQQQFQVRAKEQEATAETLSLALDVIEPELSQYAQVDWDKLAATDSYEYSQKHQAYERAQRKYNAIAQRGKQMVQQQQAQQAQRLNQMKAVEGNKLKMAIPDLGDPTKAKAFRAALRDRVKSVGIRPEILTQFPDAALIVELDKARRFDALQQGGLDAARKKLSKAPQKSMKSGKPVSSTQRKTKAKQQQQAKLKSTGKVDDAVELLLMGRK